MRVIIFFMCLMFVGASWAATMCVPDLSACESCTGVVLEGSKWFATCCGVETNGYLFAAGGVEKGSSVHLVSTQPFSSVAEETYMFVMTYPVVAEYGIIDCGLHGNIVPKCAFQECEGSGFCLAVDPT